MIEIKKEIPQKGNISENDEIIIKLENKESQELNGIYYLLDCLDGDIGGQYLTAQEIHEKMDGKSENYTDKELIRIASNYEADLYKVEIKHDIIINKTLLYEAWGCFGGGE